MHDQPSQAVRDVTAYTGTKGFDRVRTHRFRAGTTVLEAVSSQIVPDLHASLEVRVQAVGADGVLHTRLIPRSDWAGTKLVAGEFLIVELVPQGGGRKILQSVLMLGVIIASLYLGPAIGTALKLGEVGTSIATGVVASLGALAINALVPIKPPKPDVEDTQTGIDKLQNTLSPGATVPVVFGDMRVYPPFAALPITRGNNKERTQTALFCLGYGPLKVDLASIRIGNTPLEKFRGARLDMVEGWPDEEPIGLYPFDVFPDNSSQPTLLKDEENILTTQPATDRAEVEILFPEGLVKYDAKGKRENRTVNFSVKYRQVNTGVWLDLPARVVNQANSDLHYSARRVEANGGILPVGYQPQVNTGVYSVTDRTTQPRSFIVTTEFPVRGQYEIRLKRTTAAPTKEQEGKIFDKMQVFELRSVRKESPVTMKGVAMLAVELPLNDQKPGGVSQLSVRVQRYVPIHENGAWVYPQDTRAAAGTMDKHLSSNPAYAFVYAAHGYGTWSDPAMPGAGLVKHPGTAVKRQIPLSAIDTGALLAWRDACDAPDARTGAPRHRYDRIVAGTLRLRDILNEIGAAGRARVAAPSGRLGVAMDRVQTAVQGIFTPRNINRLSGNIALKPQPHAVSMRITDRDNDYRESEVIAYGDGYGPANATDIYSLPAAGVTERWRAWEFGEYYRRAARARAEIISFSASVDALHNSVGDYVLLKHDVPRTLPADAGDDFPGGRVRAVLADETGTAFGLRLDEPVTMQGGVSYCLSVRRAQVGDMVLNASLASQVGMSDIVSFASPVAGHGINVGDLVVFGRADQVARDVVIIDIRPASDLSAVITVADLANDIHDVASVSLPVFPDYVSAASDALTRAPAKVDNLHLTEQLVTDGGLPQLRLSLGWRPGAGGVAADHFEIYEHTNEDHGGIVESQYRYFGTTRSHEFQLPHEFAAGEAVELAVVAVSAGGTKLPVRDATHVAASLTLEGDASQFRNDAAGLDNRLWMIADTKTGVAASPTLSTGTSTLTIASAIAAPDISMVAGDPICFSALVTTATPGLFQLRLRLKFLDAALAQVAVAEGAWVYPTGGRIGVAGVWPTGATTVSLQWQVRNPTGVSATDGVAASGLSLSEGQAVVPWVLPVVPGATRNEHRGAFDVGTAYLKGDMMTWAGSSYMLVVAGPVMGDAPPSANWALLAAKGETGLAGLNNALVYAYKRAATVPTVPGVATSFTFATGVLTGLTGGWSQGVPDGTDPLYVTVATASSTTGTDNIGPGEWSSPVIQARHGADGINSASVFLYRRAATVPAVPSVTTTYTFATGLLASINNGWSQTVPAGGDPLYVTTASAASTGATDTIAPGEWAAPAIMAVDGADGVNALTGLLTNESHTLAALTDGTVPSFAGAGGGFQVFVGTTEITTGNGVVFAEVSETGCTGTINVTTGVYSVSAMSADTATYIMSATFAGTTIQKTFTLAKSKTGSTGPTGQAGEKGEGVVQVTGLRGLRWGFSSGLNGWTGVGGTLSHLSSKGYAQFVTSSTDPHIDGPSGLSHVGSLGAGIRMMVRATGAAVTGAFEAFYTTAGHGFTESFKKTLPSRTYQADGEWTAITFDMRDLTAGGTDWLVGTITRIRIDFPSVSGVTWQVDGVVIGPIEAPLELTADTVSDVADYRTANGYQAGALFSDTFDQSTSLEGWEVISGTGELTRVASTGVTGGFLLQLGNGAGNDEVRIAHKGLIPYNPDKLYEFSCRILRTSGTGTVYLGFMGVAYDGVTLVNVTGDNTHSNQHYIGASNLALTTSFQELRGYMKGVGGTPGGTHTDPSDPATAHVNVRYLRPFLLVGVPSKPGIFEVDYVTVKEIPLDAAGRPVIAFTGALDANKIVNTNELADGAGLGQTAVWTGVSGTGKPADNATVGAPSGTMVGSRLAEHAELGIAGALVLYKNDLRATGLGIPANTNYAGGQKYSFTAPAAAGGFLHVLATDAEGGGHAGLNSLDLGTLTGPDNATVWYSIPVTLALGSNEISLWSTNLDGASLKAVVVTMGGAGTPKPS